MEIAVLVAAWLAAAVCAAAGVFNLKGAESTREQFRAFGYPAGWHLVTGVLEVVGAVLIVIPPTRTIGAALLGAVMAAALATVLRWRKFEAVAPCLLLLGGLAFVGLAG